MWVYYNPNPLAAKKIDCSVRALCKVTGMSWDDVHDEVCRLSGYMGTMPSDNDVWGAFLRRRGWRRYAVYEDGYTVRQFCRDHPRGQFVLCPSGHVVACEDGCWMDTWDSGDESVLFFWVKEDMSDV